MSPLLPGGGYAEYAVADERFCFPIPDGYDDAEAAPVTTAAFPFSESFIVSPGRLP